MELSANQINELYRFTERKLVEHYDVQSELVDHLANDIEAIITENPKIDFEEAKLIAFKKFGVFGFSDIVDQKKNQLEKKYLKIIFRDLKEWFKLPKIILTFSSIYFMYLILLRYNTLYFYIQLSLTIFILIKSFQHLKKLRIKQKSHQKKWLLERFIFTGGSVVFSLISIILSTYPQVEKYILNNPNKWLILFPASILIIEFLLIYISFFVIPKKSETLLKENYPEYTAL